MGALSEVQLCFYCIIFVGKEIYGLLLLEASSD